jgi:hypothetical protein
MVKGLSGKEKMGRHREQNKLCRRQNSGQRGRQRWRLRGRGGDRGKTQRDIKRGIQKGTQRGRDRWGNKRKYTERGRHGEEEAVWVEER